MVRGRLTSTAIAASLLAMLLAMIQPTSAQAQGTTTTADATTTATYTNSRCGNSSGRVILSFDDWAYGDPYRATRVGSYLKSRGVRGMFFLVNKFAKQYPDIISTLRSQGHWVLNHSYSHPDLRTLSDSGVSYQIRNGISSNLLRPPYGSYDSRVAGIASSLGYRICRWTIDTADWQKFDGAYRSVSSIRYRVRSASASAKSSGMVLGHLHTNYPKAVGGIIDDLYAQGYRFCRNTGSVGRTAPFPLTC
jgi:peptidoglycan/xylan/chitin deacetylase (PgdA/CDA1 family)